MTDRLTENARLRAALEWYAEQARLCRLIHREGDAGRNALAADGGKRARAALATPAPDAVQEAAKVPEIAALIEKADHIANWTIGNRMADDPENLEKYPHLAGAILDLRAALRAIAGGQP